MNAKVVPKILTLHTLPTYMYLYIKTHFVSVIESGRVHWEEERESSDVKLLTFFDLNLKPAAGTAS